MLFLMIKINNRWISNDLVNNWKMQIIVRLQSDSLSKLRIRENYSCLSFHTNCVSSVETHVNCILVHFFFELFINRLIHSEFSLGFCKLKCFLQESFRWADSIDEAFLITFFGFESFSLENQFSERIFICHFILDNSVHAWREWHTQLNFIHANLSEIVSHESKTNNPKILLEYVLEKWKM